MVSLIWAHPFISPHSLPLDQMAVVALDARGVWEGRGRGLGGIGRMLEACILFMMLLTAIVSMMGAVLWDAIPADQTWHQILCHPETSHDACF